MKKQIHTIILLLFALCLSGFLTACGANNPDQVHMNETDFVQKSVTIHKGESISLINDSSAIHAIENGSWMDTTPRPKDEAGAPSIQVDINASATQVIGPFNTAGTFHFYCSVHPGMNLSVTVN